MTVQEIIDYAANQLVRKSISLADGIAWINDALKELGTEAGIFAEQVYAVTAGTWFDLPAGCLKPYEVRDAYGDTYYGWEADAGRIRFWRDGEYTLRYYKRPATVTQSTDAPECSPEIQQALAYYVAYRLDDRDFHGEAATVAWLQEYRARVEKAKRQLPKPVRAVKVVR